MKKRYLIYIIFVWVISDDSVCRNDILADDDNFREYRTGKMAEVERGWDDGIRITLKKRENTLRIISHFDNTL